MRRNNLIIKFKGSNLQNKAAELSNKVLRS